MRYSGNDHLWYVGSTAEMVLNNNMLYPYTSGGLSLGGFSGSTLYKWEGIYINITSQTSGTANLTLDTNGKIVVISSDIKFKQNIKPINYNLLDVLKLNPVSFEWTTESERGSGPQIGFIAQEVEKIIPEVVSNIVSSDNEYKSLDYGAMVSLLTKAIQEQQTIINDLKARIEILENK